MGFIPPAPTGNTQRPLTLDDVLQLFGQVTPEGGPAPAPRPRPRPPWGTMAGVSAPAPYPPEAPKPAPAAQDVASSNQPWTPPAAAETARLYIPPSPDDTRQSSRPLPTRSTIRPGQRKK